MKNTTPLVKNHGRPILVHLITSLRVILSWILFIYLMNNFGSLRIPVILSLCIYLTDYLDGKTARLFRSASSFGEVFDVSADFLYIIIFYILLYSFSIVPLWFLWVMLLKFFEFIVTSHILRTKAGNPLFMFDSIGKWTAIIFYIIPLLAYTFFQLFSAWYWYIIPGFLYMTTCLALGSSAYRIGECIRCLGKHITSFLKNFCSTRRRNERESSYW